MTGTGIADEDSAPAFRAEAGTLYVVATPIGNLRDVTLRALDILRSADVVLAEDTRVTSALLARYAITTRSRSLHRHNERREIDRALGQLADGHSAALVTDAGTPAISDPGARLVDAALAAGVRVVPIPGPSAVAAAVSCAGLAAERFTFVGFLPLQQKARNELLGTLGALPTALVFYEAPHRIAETLAVLAHAFDGRRMLTVAREMTKQFETIARMPLAGAVEWLGGDVHRSRGEFVLVVDAPPPETRDGELSPDALAWMTALLAELPPARAARVVAGMTGLSRDALYAHALSLKPATRGSPP